MPAEITRHYVRIGSRQIHYRRAGSGIPVVLLHESPRSSLSLVPLIESLAEDFLVIAPDTPGYGLSDPIADPHADSAPELQTYAHALLETLDAVGVQRFSLYGTHTGACIAVETALSAPERVARLVLDGCPLFTGEERDDLLEHYLPAFEPRWDGSHLTSLWSRIDDLGRFFPWYSRDPEHRLPGDPLSLAAKQRTVQGFLESGSDYGRAYALAFGHSTETALAELSVRTDIIARPSDLLAEHVERLPASAERVVARRVTEEEWASAVAAALVPDGDSEVPPPVPPLSFESGRRVFIPTFHGSLHARVSGSGEKPWLVFFHDIPGNFATHEEQIAALTADYRVLAIDLPGCADSRSGWLHDSCPNARERLEAALQLIAAALRKLDTDSPVLTGAGAGRVVALRLADRGLGTFADTGDQDAGMLWPADAVEVEQFAAAVRPKKDGAHLWSQWMRFRSHLVDRASGPADGFESLERRVTLQTHSRVAALSKSYGAIELLAALVNIDRIP